MKDNGNISVLLSAVCFSLAGVLIKSIPWSPLSIEPILNPLFVAMATGERIGVFAVIGSVLVLGASAFNNISSFRAREAGP